MAARKATRGSTSQKLSEKAERLEKRRESSRKSSQKYYYKNLTASREKGAERARKIRVQKAESRQRAWLNVEERREAHRQSSRKNYYKDLAESRRKAAARARQYRAAKKMRQLNQVAIPLPQTPPPRSRKQNSTHTAANRVRVNTGRTQASVSPLPTSSPPPSTPEYRSQLRRLEEMSSGEEGNSEAESDSLPCAPPSPMFWEHHAPRLPQLPPGPTRRDERRRILQRYTDNEKMFLQAVFGDAMADVDRYGYGGYNVFWDRAYEKHQKIARSLGGEFM
ncbi:hypothetical protein DFP72DRAFT_861223 [Ephemerocybe angulata]|uniref:Uncharacterized protein n=1 Tax=Ephemerocybe angulata TaxID=980116 RepID=A0A8H6LTV0_9AGAR|nr:hypothetical protein DFP72DRAFT_861223 [Tulosesus angulatus]